MALEKVRLESAQKKQREEEEARAKEMELEKERERIKLDPRSHGRLTTWEPENDAFWKLWGWKVALPNLIVSTYNLFLMFAIWKQWGGIVKGLNAAYKNDPTAYSFGFDNAADRKAAVGILGGVCGLSGAVHRSIHGFLPGLCGGRTANFMNSLIAFVAMLIAFIALSFPDCPYWLLFMLAVVSGCGGGGFSSIMANIGEMFPRRLQGTSLGLVGGVGNWGISCAQLLLFGFGNNGVCLAGADGKCEALNVGGKYLFQVELIWTFALFVSLPLTWFYMHDLPGQGYEPPAHAFKPRRTFWNCMRFLQAQLIIYVVAFAGAFIFMLFAPLVKKTPIVACFRGFVLAALSASATTSLLFGTNSVGVGTAGPKVSEMFQIFYTRENLFLSMLYIMTFSSFIGYANMYPKLIKALYPDVTVTDYSWMAAFLGSLARVGGGFLSDKVTGAYSTAGVAFVMTSVSFGLGFVIRAAMASGDSSGTFPGYVLLNGILFLATGCGNATVFRLIGALLDKELRGPMLGWTGAMAAYGGAIFPTFFDAGIEMGVNDLMYYLISGYYAVCAFITWRYCFWTTPVP